MKLVRESISFERGLDPKEVLGIGSKKYQYKNMKPGDIFMIIQNMPGINRYKGQYIKILNFINEMNNRLKMHYEIYSKEKKYIGLGKDWHIDFVFFAKTFEKVEDIGFEK